MLVAYGAPSLDFEQILQVLPEFGRVQTSMGFGGMFNGGLQQFLLAVSKDGHCALGAGYIAAIDEFSDHDFQPPNESDAYHCAGTIPSQDLKYSHTYCWYEELLSVGV